MSTLVIHQEPAFIVHDADGNEEHGDVITYHADVTGPDGLRGVLVGVQNSVRQHGDEHWDRLGLATFRFEGDDSLFDVAGAPEPYLFLVWTANL